MGYTNETTHYSIPLPLGSDKTTPMDYNTSAQEVDTVLFEAKTDSASALQKANQLQQDLATTNGNVTAVTGRVTTLEGTVTTQGQSILQNTRDISDVRADALDMIVAKDEGTAQVATIAVANGEYFRYNDVLYIATQAIAVGDTIIPNTNCKATNVGTELSQLDTTLLDKADKTIFDGYKGLTNLTTGGDKANVADGTKLISLILRVNNNTVVSEMTIPKFMLQYIGTLVIDAGTGSYSANVTIYYDSTNNRFELGTVNVVGWTFTDIVVACY